MALYQLIALRQGADNFQDFMKCEAKKAHGSQQCQTYKVLRIITCGYCAAQKRLGNRCNQMLACSSAPGVLVKPRACVVVYQLQLPFKCSEEQGDFYNSALLQGQFKS